MITSINRNFYDSVKGTECIILHSEGCGCCSRYFTPTKRVIEDAIQDHKDFIKELEELKKELYET